MSITFSSFEPRLPTIQCAGVPPEQPITEEIQEKITRALMLLPTSRRGSTTFNHTRKDGPEGTKEVTYLLPRREPRSE